MRLLNPGALFHSRNFRKWDAELALATCNRYNNGELTITLKLFLQKVDPPGGITGTVHPDSDSNPRQIIPWNAYFEKWKQKFKADVEKAWHGKFWLKCPDTFNKWDFEDKAMIYRPNLWCRFQLELLGSPAGAHHTIRCVRLHQAELNFRSHSRLYDDRDVRPRPGPHGSKFRTHVHEVGHLLGLGHVGVDGPPGLGRTLCQIHLAEGSPGASNHSICYGVLPLELTDVMGSGGDFRTWHAKPWQDAVGWFSGVTGDRWDAAMKRFFPRSILEIPLPGKGWHTSKPNRL